MILTLVRDLMDVPATEWDALTGHAGLYLSHQWLAAHQHDPTAQVHYALVHADGRLIAAAPLHVVDSEPNALYRVHDLIPDRTPARTLLAGARRGYFNSPLLHPRLTPDRRREALNELVKSASSLAAVHEAQPWWLYVTDTAAAELADACGTKPMQLGEDARIPLPGSTFDDYLAGLPSKRRVAIRRERRAFAEAGYELRTQRLSECADPAGALLAQLQERHGHPADPAFMARLLRDQAEGMADSGVVLAAYAEGRMVAFSLFYRQADTVWLRATGYDYARLRGAHEYFNLVYYLPIEDAYAHGAAALHLGMESLRAKTLRGAVTSPLWAIEGAGSTVGRPGRP
ncbi:GNAT family N-acetyltransferase [Streptomyces sp. IMTB 2501]|uniref:GNAT family N-acetyltransferase n=1 Tax=Streptomyces sp. IMTB 2501 TaxID=1776340 RepID=UPI00096E6353|nr:GNAT family N-acetyltransferase [Streptomyces sp. IMTB 2501]OLZ65328.1 GNAT family N-acetyltransferase [Streptomyces sp. IMTB 2501]